ncbi:MAG: T9SS type A sorting domain-containing protein [Bacteroidota bacterium]|nr:T9SS type A sorting domain-containing protein [Bacteroidota bacterium]
MKAFTSTLHLSLIALMLGVTSLHAQWNTLTHDATINRGINDIFFISNVGYAAGSRADALPWGSRGLIYKTTDGGQNWNAISLPLVIGTDSVMSLKSIHFLTPNDGFAAAACYSTNGAAGIYYGALLKTTDGGVTWTTNFSAKNLITYSNGNTTHFDHIFFSSLYNGVLSGSKTLGVNTSDGISYATTNGGTSWTLATVWTGSDTRAHASFFESNGTGSIVGGKYMSLTGPYNGRIARSTNYGFSWATTFIDNAYGYVDIHFPVPQIGYAIGDSMYYTMPGDANGKLVKTINGGASWTAQAYFTNFMPLCVFFTDAMTGYIGGQTAAGNSGLKKTIDGGVTWTNEVYPDIATASLITSIAFSTPVTGYASNSYTSSNSIYGSFSQSCGVYLGADTTFCQAQGQLFATPATPGNDYVFDWTPGTGLSDSTSSSPLVSFVHNQQFIVTMTDTVTNCTATDTIIVSAYNWSTATTYTCFPDSALLDFGPGASSYLWQFFTDTNNVNSFINVNSQTIWATEPGTYSGYALFPGCGALTSVLTVVDSCTAAFVCGVDAGPDTMFCQQQGQLSATPASPGNYSFSWSPATGLDNPFVQNPNVISGVHNQQYVVTISDPSTSCIATDTVIVSAYYFHNDTLYSCNNQPVTIDIGPGGTNYTIQYTDTAGNFHYQVLPTQYFAATEPVQYFVIAYYANCGALTSIFTMIDSCNIAVGNVWPGDCNYDLSANMADALHIGLAYSATGATRPNASNLWYAQPMADWTQNYANCNYKHGDADGNGTINVNDTLPISINYGNTHPFRLAPVITQAAAPQLYLVANYDTVGLQTLVTVDVRLGTAAFPIDSLYGISFRLTADAGLIDTTLTVINLNSTWLGTTGTDMFTFKKHFRNNGSADCAQSRNNHINTLNGNGTIGTFLIVTTDNLSGIAICHINISDVTAVTASQQYLTLATVNDSVVIDPSMPAGITEAETAPSFSIYPNPANEQVTVQTYSNATQIEICDMTGRVVSSIIPNSTTTTIQTSQLATGIYLLKVRNGNAVTTQKLSVTR